MTSKSGGPAAGPVNAGTRTGRSTRHSTTASKTPSTAEATSSSLASTQRSNKSNTLLPEKSGKARSVTPSTHASTTAHRAHPPSTTSTASATVSPIPSAPHVPGTLRRRKESTTHKGQHELHKDAEATRRSNNNNNTTSAAGSSNRSSKAPATLSATALGLAQPQDSLLQPSSAMNSTLVVEDLAATSPPAIAHVAQHTNTTPNPAHTNNNSSNNNNNKSHKTREESKEPAMRRVSRSVTELPLSHGRVAHGGAKRLSSHRTSTTGHTLSSHAMKAGNVSPTTTTTTNNTTLTHMNNVFALTSAAALAKELPRSNEVRRSSTSDKLHAMHDPAGLAPLDLMTNAFDLHLTTTTTTTTTSSTVGNKAGSKGEEEHEESKAPMPSSLPHAPMHTIAHTNATTTGVVAGVGAERKAGGARAAGGQDKAKPGAASALRGTKNVKAVSEPSSSTLHNNNSNNSKITTMSSRLKPQPLPLTHDMLHTNPNNTNSSLSTATSQHSTTSSSQTNGHAARALHLPGRPRPDLMHLTPLPAGGSMTDVDNYSSRSKEESTSANNNSAGVVDVIELAMHRRQSPELTPMQRRASSRQSVLKPLTPLSTAHDLSHNHPQANPGTSHNASITSYTSNMFTAARARRPSQLSTHLAPPPLPAGAELSLPPSRRGSQERRPSFTHARVLGDIAMEDYERSSTDGTSSGPGPVMSHRGSLASQRARQEEKDAARSRQAKDREDGRRRSSQSHTPDRKECTMQGATMASATTASLSKADSTLAPEPSTQGKAAGNTGEADMALLKEENNKAQESDSEDDVRAMRQHAERILLHSAQQRAAAAAAVASAAAAASAAKSSPAIQNFSHIPLTGKKKHDDEDDEDEDSSSSSNSNDTSSGTDDDDEEDNDDDEEDDDEEDDEDDEDEYDDDEDDEEDEDEDEDDDDDEDESSSRLRRRRRRHHHRHTRRKLRRHTKQPDDEEDADEGGEGSGGHNGHKLRLMTKVSREGDCNVKVMYIYPSTRFRRYAKEVQYRFGYSKLNEFDIYCIDESGDHVDIDLEEDFELLTRPFWQRLRAQRALEGRTGAHAMESAQAAHSPTNRKDAHSPAGLHALSNKATTHDLTATATATSTSDIVSVIHANAHTTTSSFSSPSAAAASMEDRSTSTVLRLYVRDSHLLRQSQPSPRELLVEGGTPRLGQAAMNGSAVHPYLPDSTTNSALYANRGVLSATGTSTSHNSPAHVMMWPNHTTTTTTSSTGTGGGSSNRLNTLVPASPLPFPGCTEGAPNMASPSMMMTSVVNEASLSSHQTQILTPNTVLSATGTHDRLDSTQTRFQLFAETQRAQTLYLPLRENAEVQWTKMNVIGKGSYGTVYEGITSDGKLLAVKVQEIPLDEDAAATKALQAEINLMRSLRHKNIVTYYGCQTKQNENGTRQMEIFMELCHGGSLASLRRKFAKAKEPFSISLVRSYTRQVLEGLSYLHGCKVMHRDIKSDNVLISAMGDAKLADFGCSKRIGTTALPAANTTATNNNKSNAAPGLYATMVGSPLFIAPEVMQGDGGYSMAADVWAVGCLVLELLGREPWTVSGTNVFQVIFQISRAKTMPTGIPKRCPAPLMDFFRRCFDLNASQRASAAELLQHEWITCPDASLEPVPSDAEDDTSSGAAAKS